MKKQKIKEWIEFDYDDSHDLHIISYARNKIDHFSGQDLEQVFSRDDKALCYIYCKKMMQLLTDFEKR